MDTNTHQEAQIHHRRGYQDYLGEFVYGGIDGCVTTFAVVAGAAGADLAISVVLILGFANLLADGFSMSVGAYLSTKSERDNYEKHRQIEMDEVDNMPEMEREEVRQIYREKGFEGELLEQVVAVITADKDRWVDVMMKEELEMQKDQKSPLAMGAVTYVSFILVGLIPLLAYVFNSFFEWDMQTLFLVSCILTSIGFAVIGWLKAYVTKTSTIKGVLETLVLGGIAAGVAYFVGDFLEGLLS